MLLAFFISEFLGCCPVYTPFASYSRLESVLVISLLMFDVVGVLLLNWRPSLATRSACRIGVSQLCFAFPVACQSLAGYFDSPLVRRLALLFKF